MNLDWIISRQEFSACDAYGSDSQFISRCGMLLCLSKGPRTRWFRRKGLRQGRSSEASVRARYRMFRGARAWYLGQDSNQESSGICISGMKLTGYDFARFLI